MRVARRLPLGLALALLLLVLGDAALWDGWPGPVVADTWECIEYNSDYSLRCPSESTRCGSFCFWAECLECTDAYWHRHCRTTCSNGSCSTYCWSVRHGISPCKSGRWVWHLFGEDPPPSSRVDVYDSHNLEASLKFGMVPDGYVPPILDCIVQVGSSVTEELPRPNPPPPVPDDRWAGGVSDGLKEGDPGFSIPHFTTEAPYFTGPTTEPYFPREEHFTGRVLDTRAVNPVTGKLVAYPAEVGIRDLSHLPTTPGEPGAPFLIRANKVLGQDTWVELQVSGWGAGAREYRYWSYNGLRDEVDDIECRRRFPSWRTGCQRRA